MRFGRTILLVVVAVLLAAYAFDCDALATPEQAMQCCGSMPCSPQGHQGQDCCKTMPSMHAPFVQPSTVEQVSLPVVVVALPAPGHLPPAITGERIPAPVSHPPPIFSLPDLSPLRI